MAATEDKAKTKPRLAPMPPDRGRWVGPGTSAVRDSLNEKTKMLDDRCAAGQGLAGVIEKYPLTADQKNVLVQALGIVASLP